MQLIGSQTSPFTRIVRVVLEELALDCDFKIIAPYGKLNEIEDANVRIYNPLMKVPALVDGGQTIIDSRIIVKYLLGKTPHNQNIRTDFPRNIAEDNLMSVIVGVTEAGTAKFSIKFSNPEVKAGTGYLKRCDEKIKHGLEWLNQQSILGHSLGIPEIALICGLDWFKKRNVCSWEHLPHIKAVHQKYADRPSFVTTRIPDAA